MTQWRPHPILLFSGLGMLLGATILPPMVGHILHNAAFEKTYFLEYAAKPLSLYLMLSGALIGAVAGYFRSRLVSKNVELKKGQVALHEALLEKETLLRILSHDLANHLCVAQGFVRLARRNAEKVQGERLDIAGSGIEKSIDLIRFTRKFLAVESGKIDLELEDAPLKSVLADCLRTFSDKCAEKGIEVDLTAHCEEPHARIDPVAFSSCVMNNLISNAIKFSIMRGVVSVDVISRSGWVEVSVSNYGPGISRERIDGIFSMSEQTTSLGTAGEKGTGFGLPLAYKFIRLMGGEIRVESEPFTEKGKNSLTVFTVSLPSGGPRPRLSAQVVRDSRKAIAFVHRPALAA